MRSSKKALASAVVAAGFTAAACSNTGTFGEEFRDTGVANRDDTPADIIQMPEGFSNVAAKCDGTSRVYVTRNDNGRAVAVIADHPKCAAGNTNE